MNRLSIKLSQNLHKKITPIVFTPKEERMFYGDEYCAARAQAYAVWEKQKEENIRVQKDLGIVFDVRYVCFSASKNNPDWWGDVWEVKGKGDFLFQYRTSVGHRICFYPHAASSVPSAFIVPPSTMDILCSIRNDNPQDMSFERWCLEFGYDSDSRSAERIYWACVEQTMMFRRNYPDVNLDAYEPLRDY